MLSRTTRSHSPHEYIADRRKNTYDCIMNARTVKTTLIAPCGMNCALCREYMRDDNSCPGCRNDHDPVSRYRATCRIKNCAVIKDGGVKFCFACAKYPCDRLKRLDKRYRTKYGMSMIENLDNIKRSGVREFVRQEKLRWACPECGETICVHQAECISCSHRWR